MPVAFFMKILGIDTATSSASVALVDAGKLVMEEIYPQSRPSADKPSLRTRPHHSTTVLPLIETLLQKAKVSFDELSALAVSIGPGSFTGLRIGLSTVKGLVYGSNVPVVAISTLAAMAARVTDAEGLVCPISDARKNEVYAALFTKMEGKLQRLTSDRVSPAGTILEQILSRSGEGRSLFVGDGVRVCRDLILSSLGDRAVLTSGDDYPSIASGVAFLAEDRVRRSDFDPIGPLVPVYLRPSEAEMKKL
jgi:tRNA threonylcarbamoyladenosine biosynthesis protein TsaB